MKTVYMTEEEMRRKRPEVYEQMMEQSREQQRREKDMPKPVCLDCGREDVVRGTRYCEKHNAYYTKLQEREVKSGAARGGNYAYSEKGFNIGLNAYVRDKEDFKRKAKELQKREGLEAY